MSSASPIYVSTACLPGPVPLAARLAEYGDHGLSAVELGAGVIPEPGWPEIARSQAGPLLLHNYFPPPPVPFVLNLASANREIAAASANLVQNALSLCRALNIPFYSVHGGFITDPVIGELDFEFPPPADAGVAGEALARMVTQVDKAAERAAEVGVTLLLENNVCPTDLAGKLLFQTPEDCAAAFERLADPEVRLLLDTGHLKVSAQTHNFSRDTFIERLQDRIGAVHLHTNDGLVDQHLPVAPDGWEIKLLQRECFSGLPIIVEAKFPDVARLVEHVQALRQLLRR